VVRLGLPESIEQLYQETGRAGRDGLPADCYIFLGKERQRAARFLHQPDRRFAGKRPSLGSLPQIQRFVGAEKCRQKEICNHFGEVTKWDSCGVCDICAGTPKWLSGINQNSKATSQPTRNPNRLLEAAGYELNPTVQVKEELREFLREWRRNTAHER